MTLEWVIVLSFFFVISVIEKKILVIEKCSQNEQKHLTILQNNKYNNNVKKISKS